MALESAQVQRLSTMIAALSPRFDQVAHEFFDRFAKACPASNALRPPAGKRARSEFAAGVAMVLKNVGRLQAADAVFDYAGRCCRDANIGPADMQNARGCLIGALRQAAGDAWSPQAEADFNDLIGECFREMQLGAPVAHRAAA